MLPYFFSFLTILRHRQLFAVTSIDLPNIFAPDLSNLSRSTAANNVHRLTKTVFMSKPVLGCEIALAIPLGVVLLYYIFKISIDITPTIIEYVRSIGIDLTKYVDPSLITSSLACGTLILLNGLNYVLDVTGVWDRLIKKLEKPKGKDLGDEKMGLDYSLPLYHNAGTIGDASAVNMGSGCGGRTCAFPCVVREEPDRSMSWWAENMHKRFYEEAY